MRKEMLKPVSKIFALCIVLSMFVGNGANASAAQGGGCPFDEYGYHYYNQHKGTSDGYYEYGTHEHKMGYDNITSEAPDPHPLNSPANITVKIMLLIVFFIKTSPFLRFLKILCQKTA